MADAQAPWGVAALGGEISAAAWRDTPSWYVVATEDRMIPPPAQQGMAARAGATVTEVAASHSVFLSKPDVVADVIRQALAGS
jgi:pimeloyl-ACP methyl ester carboxylesterase